MAGAGAGAGAGQRKRPRARAAYLTSWLERAARAPCGCGAACASLPCGPCGPGPGDGNPHGEPHAAGRERRYSDPCLGGAGAGAGEPGTDSEEEAPGGSKLVMCLVDQIDALKMTNERLNKDLQEARAELQTLRQQTSIWHTGSTSSLGTPQNHTPHNNNGYITSPLHQYSPGVLTDLVREIREAARLREEALYARVRSMIDERNLNQNGLSAMDKSAIDSRNYEDIRSELRAADADKRRMSERLAKMEEQLHHLRMTNGLSESLSSYGGAGGGGRASPESEEAERERLRRELSESRRAKQIADEKTLKLERLITQMRSKFNGLHVSSAGPASLASSEHDVEPSVNANVSISARARRTSTHSASNSPHSTIVFGPVTDL